MNTGTFFLLGLLAIGAVFSGLSRSVRVHTTADQNSANQLLWCGVLVAGVWILVVGSMSVLTILSCLKG